MTIEERIAQLEAELERERARADSLQEIVHALTVKRRSAGAERQARYRERSTVTRDVTSDVTVTRHHPPPPLDGSPPPSVPSSPSPLSSPPSLFPPPSSVAPELRLEPQVAPRQARKAKPKPERPTDPRHAQLTRDLCQVQGWPHHGGRTAKAIAQLLELAAQAGRAPEEVLRRAAFAREHEGFPRVRELHELVTHWGHFAEPPRGQGPPRASPNSGIMRSTASGCAACGGDGECASVGSDGVSLCYGSPLHGAPPGCMALWYAALDGGEWKPEQAAEWAERRRHAV